MAMTAKMAMAKLRNLVATSSPTVCADNAFWTLAILYNRGKQWGRVNSAGGNMRVQYMRNITDPQRSDVRVTMNEIGKLVDKIKSEINPSTLSASYDAIGGSADHRVIADLSGKLMKQHLKDIQGVRVYRDVNLARCVLGSCAIRRTLSLKGQRLVRNTTGGNMLDGRLKEYTVGWARAYPWEFMRDPAAVSLWVEKDEDIICHFKPRTVRWVKERFPTVEIKSQTTMGRLMDFNRSVRVASGLLGNSPVANSTEPGVMFYECYFKHGNTWDKTLFAFGDPSNNEAGAQFIDFVDNPFYGLPFHFFHYEHPVQMPWARGIPHLLMAAQDIGNLGWTWVLRTMQASQGKWVIERGSVEKPNRMLTNRLDRPIVWDRSATGFPQNAAPPRIEAGAIPSPAGLQVIGTIPTWMRNALNLSDVQSGITSKRGESGPAIQAKLEQAGVPLDDIRREDELELDRLLYHTLLDVTNRKWMRLDTARKLVGPDIPSDYVRTLVRVGTKNAIGGATVYPPTLRPRTQAQTRENLASLVERGVVDAPDAVWEMDEQNQVVVHTGMSNAKRKQLDEVARMIAGGDAAVDILDHHDFHIRALKEYADRPEWHTLTKPVRDKFNEHFVGHLQARQELAQIEAAGLAAQEPGPPAQGSPPATAEGSIPVPGGAAAPLQQAVA